MPRLKTRFLTEIYHRISLREKLLLTVFVWVILTFLATEVAKSTRLHLQTWAKIRTQNTLQTMILEREADYDRRFAEIQERFNPQLTLDESELRNRLESICLQMNLSYQIESRLSQKEGSFSLHEVLLNLNKINIEALLSFHQKTLKSSPYMRLDAMRLTPLRGNESQLNARFTFKSFEMTAENAQFKPRP
jgi:hypothetical protein